MKYSKLELLGALILESLHGIDDEDTWPAEFRELYNAARAEVLLNTSLINDQFGLWHRIGEPRIILEY